MNNLQFSGNNQGIAILGSEYCSGYIDSLGKWNTGFYCPSSDETVDVFCCGSSTHKYCCTKKETVLQEEMEGLTVLIGVMVGAFTAILLLTIVFCMCYKKKEPEKYRGSLYHPTNPFSYESRVTNTYSMINGVSGSTSLTGQDTGRPYQLYNQEMSHSHTLPHILSNYHSFWVREDCKGMDNTDRKYDTIDIDGPHIHEQPPAYHNLPPTSYPLIPQDTPFFLSETKIQADTALHSLSQNMDKENIGDMDMEEEDCYQSTKF